MNRLRFFRALACACAIMFIISPVSLFAGITTQTDTIRIMDYNLLDYPGSTAATRDPYFRVVLGATNPDILVVEEMTSQAGVNTFLSDVLNYSQSGLYSTITFHDGPDTDPHLYYKSTKVTFLSASYFLMVDSLRTVGVFVLRNNVTLDTIRLYAVHLKASTGSTNVAKRAAEAAAIRDTLNNLPVGTKFMVMGDFNLYTSGEAAWTNLTGSQTNNNGRLKDPINQVGSWQDNSAFSLYHTQSPCAASSGCIGSNGGMDDRFDFILTSYSSLDSNTIVSSYKAYGNDGQHLNKSIIDTPTDTAVAVGMDTALYKVSDHLPVICDFRFSNGSSPGAFLQISPTNSASNQSVSGTLNWHSSSGATSYDVYLGTTNPPTTIVSSSQTDTTYSYSGLLNNITYYWKITAKNSSGSTDATGSPWSFATIVASPAAFTLTSPSNGATYQAISGTLSWQTSTNATGYDVYLGTSNPPTTKVSSNQSGTTYAYSSLSNSTTYYWKVVARNVADTVVATGSPWSFTTIIATPGTFSLTSPSSGATNQAIAGTLSWQSSTNASGYDVYFDTNNPPTTVVSSNQSGTTYAYSGLSNSTTYYWKIVARNTADTVVATGSPWSFTTIVASPAAFTLISPSNGETNLAISGTFSWQTSTNATGYDVYLSTTNPPTTKVGSNQSGTTFAYSGLLNGTNFYWKVVARNTADTVIATGSPWSFTTIVVPPAAFTLTSPSNGATDQAINGTLSWQTSTNATGYDVYLDTTNPPTTKVSSNQSGATYAYSGLMNNTTHYWTVVALNTVDTMVATGSPWSFTTANVPVPPSTFTASNIMATSLHLSWSDVINETGYRIYRSTGGTFSQVGTDLPQNTTAFDDTGLQVNQHYVYRVVAFNDLGEGNYIEISANTLSSTPGTPSLSDIGYVSLVLTIDTADNPASTQFAIKAVGDSTSWFVQRNGTLGSTPAWQTFSGWGGISGTKISRLRTCASYSFSVKSRNIDSIESSYGGTSAQTLQCFTVTSDVQNGWNLISLPVKTDDIQRSMAFPSSLSQAFAYGNRYIATDSMCYRIGYWLKFGTTASVSFSDQPIIDDTIMLKTGWNMIGSISVPVSVGSIGQEPTNMVSSSYFGYSGSYVRTDSLSPMRGYWVKARTPGTLFLNASLTKATPATNPLAEVEATSSSFTFVDAAGHSTTLFVDENPEHEKLRDNYELPPSPFDASCFDVRFTSQTDVEFVPLPNQLPVRFPISIIASNYPIRVTWKLAQTNLNAVYQLASSSETTTLPSDGEIVLQNSTGEIAVIIGADASSAKPKEFRVEQNYPNPFNPSTKIAFELPQQSRVTIKVFDVLGNNLLTCLDHKFLDAGRHEVQIDGTSLSSGLYFYRVVAEESASSTTFSSTRKMLLLK